MHSIASDSFIGFHSLLGHFTSLELLYPTIRFTTQSKIDDNGLFDLFIVYYMIVDYNWRYSSLTHSFPCDVHLVNIRALSQRVDYNNRQYQSKPNNQYALIMHRFGMNCRSKLITKSGNCRATGLGEVCCQYVSMSI